MTSTPGPSGQDSRHPNVVGIVRLMAAWAFAASLMVGLASLLYAARFFGPSPNAYMAISVAKHDLLLLGLVPMASMAMILLLLSDKMALAPMLREVGMLMSIGYALLVLLVTTVHGMLFYQTKLLEVLPDAYLAALGIGLLTPVFLTGSQRAALWRQRLLRDESSATIDSPASRAAIDRSCRVVMTWFASGTFWLLAGSVLALAASVKLHSPYWLADIRWLTFGRVRPAHLNAMIFGWGSMTGIGTALWLQARLARTPLPFLAPLYAGAYYWNAAVAFGLYEILAGHSSSVEWLEFPAHAAVPLTVVFVLLFLCSVQMLVDRKTEHLYVSQWYLFGAVFWFPFLYLTAMIVIFLAPISGDIKAIANWWFAHNVLGLWLTPIGLAAAYYLIPKVLGRPVHSYYLSILGFWSLALFYNWAGTHHLIGGPVSAWLVTLGIVGSIMMFVPVITVAINHHLTTVGHFDRLVTSPTLRFTVFGAMSYTLVSLQGSLMALRNLNKVTHFTHYTIAHAHLGVYAFFTMIMFGAVYYIAPRLTGREWYSARLIKIHFWSCAVGISIYFVGLTWGGIGQGLLMADPEVPILRIVQYTLPFLLSRSLAGILMTLGHIAFAVLMVQMMRGQGAQRSAPTLFGRHGRDEAAQLSGGNT